MQSCDQQLDIGADIDSLESLKNAPENRFNTDNVKNILLSPVSSSCTNETLIGTDSDFTVSSTKTIRAEQQLCSDSYLFDTNVPSESCSFIDKFDADSIQNVHRIDTSSTLNETLITQSNNEPLQEDSDAVKQNEQLDIFEKNQKNTLLSDKSKIYDEVESQHRQMRYELLAELINKVFTVNTEEADGKKALNVSKRSSQSSTDNEVINYVNSNNDTDNISETQLQNISKHYEIEMDEHELKCLDKVSKSSANEIPRVEFSRVKKQISNFESGKYGSDQSNMKSKKSASNTSLQPQVIHYKGSKYSLKHRRPSEKFFVKGMKNYFPQVKMQIVKTKSFRKSNQNIIINTDLAKCEKSKKRNKIKENEQDLYLESICIPNLLTTSHISRKGPAKETLPVNNNNKTGDESGNLISPHSSDDNQHECSTAPTNPTIEFQSERILPFKNDVVNVAIALGYNQSDAFQKYKNITDTDKRVLIPHWSSTVMDVLIDTIPSYEIAKRDLSYESEKSDHNIKASDLHSGNNYDTNISAQQLGEKTKTKLQHDEKICSNFNEGIPKTNFKDVSAKRLEESSSVKTKQLEISGESILQKSIDTPVQNTLRKGCSIPNDEIIKSILKQNDINNENKNLADLLNSSPIFPEVWEKINYMIETIVMRLEVSLTDKIVNQIKTIMTDAQSKMDTNVKPLLSEIINEKVNRKIIHEKIDETIIQIDSDPVEDAYDKNYNNHESFLAVEAKDAKNTDLRLPKAVKENIEIRPAAAEAFDDSKMCGDVSLQCELVDKEVIDQLKTSLNEDPYTLLPGPSKHHIKKLKKPSLLRSCVNMLKSPVPTWSEDFSNNYIGRDVVKVSIESECAAEAEYHPNDLLGKAALFVRENIMVLSTIPIFILAMAVLYLFILMTKLP